MPDIRGELLMKARRDTSKLVKVQRMVSRGGKTFPQYFWVAPNQVKASDKILSNAQLVNFPGSVPKPAAGVLDAKYLDSLKSDKPKAIDYIKSCGVTWKESTNPGVNWMRALMAFNAAAGIKKQPKPAKQVTSQQPAQTQPTAQPTQQSTAISKDSLRASAMIAPFLTELNACKDGKERVALLKKKLGQDGCLTYSKLAGVQWNEHQNRAINLMRMSMALTKMFDSNSTPSATTSATASPATTGQGQVGAPMGNQNAKQTGTPTVQQMKDSLKAATMISPFAAEYKACKDGRERVTLLKKKLGQDGCMEYAKLVGAQWTEHSNHPINVMRMSMALAKLLDDDGTGSKVGAPMGNQNAKKDGPKADDKKDATPPPPPPETLEIKSDFTPRQKNLAELINKTTDVTKLKVFAKTGIVAEDDKAFEFLKALQKDYKEKMKETSSTGFNTFGNEEQFTKLNNDKFAPIMKGLGKKAFYTTLKNLFNPKFGLNMGYIVCPRDTIQACGSGQNVEMSFTRADIVNAQQNMIYDGTIMVGGNLIKQLDQSFSQNAQTPTGDYETSVSNLGYYGNGTKTQNDTHDKNGFLMTLEHISKADPTLKDTCDRMKGQYEHMLDLCHGDLNLLHSVIDGSDAYADPSWRYNTNAAYQAEADGYRVVVDKCKEIADKYHLTEKEVMWAMNRWAEEDFCGVSSSWRNRDYPFYTHGDDTLKDSNGNVININDLFKGNTIDYTSSNGQNKSEEAVMKLTNFGGYNFTSALTAIQAMYTTGKDLTELTPDELEAAYTKLGDASKDPYNQKFVQSHYTLSYSRTSDKIKDYVFEITDRVNTMKRSSAISDKDYLEVQKTLTEMFGQEICEKDPIQVTGPNSKPSFIPVNWDKMTTRKFSELVGNRARDSYWQGLYKAKSIVRKGKDDKNLDVVLSNLVNIQVNANMMRDTARKVPNVVSDSAANDYGSDLSKNFDYYVSDIGNGNGYRLGSTRATKSKPTYGMYGGQKELTADELNSRIKKQLENTPVLTADKWQELHDYVVDPKTGEQTKCGTKLKFGDAHVDEVAQATRISYDHGDTLDSWKGTPMWDLAMSHLEVVPQYLPQFKTKKIKTEEDVRKAARDKLGITEAEAEKKKTKENKAFEADIFDPNNPQLRAAREEVFSKVHCSIATSSEQETKKFSDKVRADWDKGQKGASGRPLYDMNDFKINAAYQVKNSLQEEKFIESKAKVEAKKNDPHNGTQYDTDVVQMYHGTDFRGCCGILGVDGRFRAPKNAADAEKNGLKYAGSMLGGGVYLADMAGKSAGYLGDWTDHRATKHGTLLVCNAVLGDHARANDMEKVKYRYDVDTVSLNAGAKLGGGGRLRADEWCVRNPDFVSPQYILDTTTWSKR